MFQVRADKESLSLRGGKLFSKILVHILFRSVFLFQLRPYISPHAQRVMLTSPADCFGLSFEHTDFFPVTLAHIFEVQKEQVSALTGRMHKG